MTNNLAVKPKRLLLMATAIIMALFLAGCASGDNGVANGDDGGGEGATSETNDESTTSGEAEPTEPETADEGPIWIGISAAQSGSLAAGGTNMLNGVELGIEMVNEDGGINGRMLELDVRDDAGDPAVAGQIAEEFGEDDSIVAVIGSYGSGPSLAQSEILETYGVPGVYNQASSSQMVSRDLEYVYNTYPLAAEEASGTAEFMTRQTDISDVALVWVNNEFGEDGRNGAVSVLEEEGVEVVVDESFDIATTDFGSVARTLNSEDPDFVWIVGYAHNHIGLVQAMKEQDVVPRYYHAPGGVNFQAPVQESLGLDADADWVVMAPLWWPGVDRPGEEEVRQAYQERFGAEIGAEAVNGFIGVEILAEAMRSADEISRESINQALDAVSVETLNGPATFDERGQAVWDIPIVQLQDGEFVPLYLDGEDLAAPAEFKPWSER